MTILYSLIKAGKVKVNQYSPVLYRFWKYTNKLGPIHPIQGRCWVWTKCTDGDGYGQFQVLGENKAHRVAYKLFVGEIPQGLKVLHGCDNPSCVNPKHLFVGTHEDNMLDMTDKCRAAKGEDNGNSKLTEGKVKEIRSRYKPKHPVDGRAALAREFGVHDTAIYQVVFRKIWKHVE